MKEIVVFLSPFIGNKTFTDEVSGMTFDAGEGHGAKFYTVKLEGIDPSGLQKALQRNILLAYDQKTVEFLNATNLQEFLASTKEEVKVEVAAEAVVEEVKEEASEEVSEEAPKAKRKKA
jgi:hypothetical protein